MGLQRNFLILAAAVTAVSCAAPLIRLASAPALTVAFWRVALAALGIVALSMFRAGWRVSLREWGLTWLAGGFLGLHFWIWIQSLRYTSVANSVLLVTTQPIWTALLGRVLLRERVPLLGVAGIALTLAGTTATVGYGGVQFYGDMLALAGGVLAAAYLIVGRRERQKWDTIPYLARVYSCSAVLLALALAGTGTPMLPERINDWWLFGALAAVPTGIGHSLYNLLLGQLPAYVVATSITGEPIGATLLGFWWLGETPPLRTLLAAPLILAGIVLVARSQRRADDPAL